MTTTPRKAPARRPAQPVSNAAIAANLRKASGLLAAQAADPFRIAAYRRAAESVDALDRPLHEIAAGGGRDALERIPHVGRSISGALLEMAETGRWSYLDALRGEVEPEQLLRRVPGIGPKLAARLHEELGIETLEDLEAAAHDGRLAALGVIGPRRAAALRSVLGSMLSNLGRRRSDRAAVLPDVSMILDVDREYREGARAGTLQKIAPRRFNPEGEAWLPILHTERPGGWRFTALYSNTARAHALGREHDWVVVAFHGPDGPESQCTVVTETRGERAGMRVVRGREAECAKPGHQPRAHRTAAAGSSAAAAQQ